jgi:predicted ribonuclease YlaK
MTQVDVKHCYLFADTMIFLHFPPIDQLKLHELLGVDQITLIFPLVIIQELEKHKDSHKNQRVKDRAREALKGINAANKGERVFGHGIDAKFFNPDIHDDMKNMGLDPTSNDIALLQQPAFMLKLK